MVMHCLLHCDGRIRITEHQEGTRERISSECEGKVEVFLAAAVRPLLERAPIRCEGVAGL